MVWTSAPCIPSIAKAVILSKLVGDVRRQVFHSSATSFELGLAVVPYHEKTRIAC